MGQDFNIACKTCNIVYYLGYGGQLTKISGEEKFLKDHYGHEFTETFSTDYLKIRDDGHLWTDVEGLVWDDDYKDSIFIANYEQYKQENL